MKATILVDWDMFRNNPYTQNFIAERLGLSRLVLLVSNPQEHDYDPELDISDIVEFDVVVRNSRPLSNVAFKQKALNVLRDVGEMEPVIALDQDLHVNRMYKREGVLLTTEDLS